MYHIRQDCEINLILDHTSMIRLYHIRLDCEIKPVIKILEYIFDLSYCKVITTKQSLLREIENLKFIKEISVLNLILNNYYLVAFWYNRYLYYNVTLKIIVFVYQK